MRRYSPPYYSPPRRGYGGGGGGGYGGRPRSPPRRGGGYGGERGGRPKEQNNGSLLVRNIPLDCRPEELRVPFESFGVVRDVYLPKDYYTGQPRGFAFVQFVDPDEAAEAQYYMNRKIFAGREITVVLAAETRKRPEEMRRKTSRGPVSHDIRRSYRGRSRSRSRTRSPPRYPSGSRSRPRSRSYSPASRRSSYTPSPGRRESDYPRSSRDRVLEREHAHYPRKGEHDYEETYADKRIPSPLRVSRSPSGSRSRSADISPRR